jgi:hypothetical protein
MNRRRPDRGLVGHDLSSIQMTRRRRIPPAAIAGLLLAGFFLAALRVEIIELGYALGTAVRQENELEEERRVLKVQLEALRNPERLRELAAERGFQRADHVVELGPLVLASNEGPRP